MSELLQNAEKRKALLKHMILQLHKGEAPSDVRPRLVQLLGKIPYGEVVEVEQELMAEGLPEDEVLRMCDVHGEALRGQIEKPDTLPVPAGHPLDTFQKENEAVLWEVRGAGALLEKAASRAEQEETLDLLNDLRQHFYRLLDIDKHYKRKELLLFSILERHEITGPSRIMWGKDDEARQLLKEAVATLEAADTMNAAELLVIGDLTLHPALTALEEMILKESEILFPMSKEKLSEAEWFEIYSQAPDIGFCLYDPHQEWRPALIKAEETLLKLRSKPASVQLPSGSFTIEELTAVLNTIPFDITFVDRNDEVRFFSEGKERIFARNRAIIGRNVRRCHPPTSLKTVEQIIDDFKAGRADNAAFWITMNERFIHIEYFALRGSAGEYLGVLEVSQDLTEKRRLEGERRLLSYSEQG